MIDSANALAGVSTPELDVSPPILKPKGQCFAPCLGVSTPELYLSAPIPKPKGECVAPHNRLYKPRRTTKFAVW